MKVNNQNEKIKRTYLRWLRESQGYSESTISSFEGAIWHYDDFTKNEDYKSFSHNKAVAFKKNLQERSFRGKPISITTVYHHLRHLQDFFRWLSDQPGYKSKINRDSISYLTLEKKKVREAITPKLVNFPSLDYVRKLVDSIPEHNEVDRRDKALIAFLLLSGMRDKAVSTLPLACFDRQTLEIIQDPQKGVDTKFGKLIQSYLFSFDDNLVRCVTAWAEYLEKEKQFGPADPLFPRNKITQTEGGLSFISTQVEPFFWKTSESIRRIIKDRCRKSGLDYYHPHSFRHAAVYLAFKNCRTAEELKAVSQNFGHSHVGTTMMSYGNLDTFRVSEIIRSMDYSSRTKAQNKAEAFAKVKKLIDEIENNS